MLVTAVVTGEYIEDAQPNMLVTAVITGEYKEEAQPKYAGYRCNHW